MLGLALAQIRSTCERVGRWTFFVDTQLKDLVVSRTGDLNVFVTSLKTDTGVCSCGGVCGLGHCNGVSID